LAAQYVSGVIQPAAGNRESFERVLLHPGALVIAPRPDPDVRGIDHRTMGAIIEQERHDVLLALNLVHRTRVTVEINDSQLLSGDGVEDAGAPAEWRHEHWPQRPRDAARPSTHPLREIVE